MKIFEKTLFVSVTLLILMLSVIYLILSGNAMRQLWLSALTSMPEVRDDSIFPFFQGGGGYKLVIQDTYTLSEGQTLDGNLFILNGMADLKEDSRVKGNIILMGGTLSANGTIEGDVTALSGVVDLGDAALVEGNVNNISGRIDRASGARIEGQLNEDLTNPFPLVLPGRMVAPSFNMDMTPFGNILWLFFRSFMWATLGVLVVLFLPRHVECVAGAVVHGPLISGGLGLLTTLVAPLLLLFLAITIICSPLALVGVFLFLVAWTLGVIVIGLEAGKRISQLLKQEWAPAVSAGAGAFLVTLIGNSIGLIVPCIGWMAPALIGMLGLGAVIVTRFGTEEFPSEEAPTPSQTQVDIKTPPALSDTPPQLEKE
jgi:hypothetical protein